MLTKWNQFVLAVHNGIESAVLELPVSFQSFNGSNLHLSSAIPWHPRKLSFETFSLFPVQFVVLPSLYIYCTQKCLLTVAPLLLFSRRCCLQSSSLNCCHVVGYLSAALKVCGCLRHRFYLRWWWEKQTTHKSNHTLTLFAQFSSDCLFGGVLNYLHFFVR